jgi:hypothetical protein
MACLCAHIIIINVSYSARVQSHGASLPLLKRLHQGRRQHLKDQARVGASNLDQVKIVYAIRDWPHEDDQEEKKKVVKEILQDFSLQWRNSAHGTDDNVSGTFSLTNIILNIYAHLSRLGRSGGWRV